MFSEYHEKYVYSNQFGSIYHPNEKKCVRSEELVSILARVINHIVVIVCAPSLWYIYRALMRHVKSKKKL